MRKERENERTEELCPGCGEEITLSTPGPSGEVEVDCPCGCSLAVA